MANPNRDPSDTTRNPTIVVWRRGVFWAARTRILIAYAVLIVAFVGVSIPIFRQLMVWVVSARVEEDLVEDLEAVAQAFEDRQALPPDSRPTLSATLESFLSSFRPEDDNFVLFWVNGQFHRSVPLALPEILQPDSDLVTRLTDRLAGPEIVPSTPPTVNRQGNILYIATPLPSDGSNRNQVIVAHILAGEVEETLAAIAIFMGMSTVTVGVALFLAWLATGYLLQPIQDLTLAARSIRESNLTNHRLAVGGSGEMAELGQTFNLMLDRLQDTFELQRDFIRDASHEMRTPLTIVRGHLELMDEPSPDQQETIDLAIDELDRMSRFVSDLMLLTRSELPDFLMLAPFEIGPFTDEILAKARILGDRHWQLDARAEGILRADRQRLTGALMNLADNAVRHTQANDAIAIGSEIDDGMVRFWVRDTGPGIAPEDRERIFRRFARGNSSPKSQGSGLGLAIVKAKAEAHGGWVELSSQVGVGSKFVLAIPLEPPETAGQLVGLSSVEPAG